MKTTATTIPAKAYECVKSINHRHFDLNGKIDFTKGAIYFTLEGTTDQFGSDADERHEIKPERLAEHFKEFPASRVAVCTIAAPYYKLKAGDTFVKVRTYWANGEGKIVVKNAKNIIQHFPDIFFS